MYYTAKEYSKEILNVIDNKKIIISKKEKNINFLKKYSLTDTERKNIIRGLNGNNFVEKRENKDPKIKTNWLYIFAPLYKLTNQYGEEKLVKLYIKICNVGDLIYAESFHEDSDY